MTQSSFQLQVCPDDLEQVFPGIFVSRASIVAATRVTRSDQKKDLASLSRAQKALQELKADIDVSHEIMRSLKVATTVTNMTVDKVTSVVNCVNPQWENDLPDQVQFVVPSFTPGDSPVAHAYVRLEGLPKEVQAVIHSCLATHNADSYELLIGRVEELRESVLAARPEHDDTTEKPVIGCGC